MPDLKIKEFAKEINVCEKIAREMARSEAFIKNNISFDISRKEKQRGKKQNKQWRISIDRYHAARDKGIV